MSQSQTRHGTKHELLLAIIV